MGKRFSEAKARWGHSCALSQMVGKRLQNFEGKGWKGWAATESKFVGWGSLCTRRKPFPSNCFECLQDEAFCQLRYDVPFSHRGDWGGKGKKKGIVDHISSPRALVTYNPELFVGLTTKGEDAIFKHIVDTASSVRVLKGVCGHQQGLAFQTNNSRPVVVDLASKPMATCSRESFVPCENMEIYSKGAGLLYAHTCGRFGIALAHSNTMVCICQRCSMPLAHRP